VVFAVIGLHYALYSPPRIDYDYDPVSLSLCYFPGLGYGPPAPYPPSTLEPLGQPFDGKTIRYKVLDKARSETSVAGQHAHGRFLVVDVSMQYIGLTRNGSTMSPRDFQLVDPNGGVNCIIKKPTNNSNPDTLPYSYPPPFWSIQLDPAGPPVTITLVFDIDKTLIQGAYLRAIDPGGATQYNFDLGLG